MQRRVFTISIVMLLCLSIGFTSQATKEEKEIAELNERVSFLKRELVIKAQESHDLVLDLSLIQIYEHTRRRGMG